MVKLEKILLIKKEFQDGKSKSQIAVFVNKKM